MSFEYHDSVDPSEFELEQGQEQEQAEPEQAGSFERGFVWDSGLEAVDEAEEKVRESLAALNWPEEKIDDVALAAREAVANAVIHGNLGIQHMDGETPDSYDARWRAASQGEGGDKKVNLEIYASEKEVRVVVTDEGNFVAAPEPVPDPENEGRGMMPSGRGIGIIVEKCDAVEAAPGQLTLIKYRDGSPETADVEEAAAL
ncbi:MAG: ATP-binding protein [Candidatus Pacebacteria bacterium]|nr:ATP-binding protein [Candidatus Paceibacterota bacterium]